MSYEFRLKNIPNEHFLTEVMIQPQEKLLILKEDRDKYEVRNNNYYYIK